MMILFLHVIDALRNWEWLKVNIGCCASCLQGEKNVRRLSLLDSELDRCSTNYFFKRKTAARKIASFGQTTSNFERFKQFRPTSNMLYSLMNASMFNKSIQQNSPYAGGILAYFFHNFLRCLSVFGNWMYTLIQRPTSRKSTNWNGIVKSNKALLNLKIDTP